MWSTRRICRSNASKINKAREMAAKRAAEEGKGALLVPLVGLCADMTLYFVPPFRYRWRRQFRHGLAPGHERVDTAVRHLQGERALATGGSLLYIANGCNSQSATSLCRQLSCPTKRVLSFQSTPRASTQKKHSRSATPTIKDDRVPAPALLQRTH
jgi:hypothetical protein